jgi:hypothetical protein
MAAAPHTLPRPARLVCGAFALVMACGSRTGLLVPAESTGDDGGGDDGGDDGSVRVPKAPPRQVGPLSTSRVTRRQPTLRWTLPDGIPDATVDLCSDRACTRPIGTPVHVTGTSYTPTTPLPTGVVYWRLHPATDTKLTSPTWQLTVGATSAPVDASWGTTLDVNGDGYADVVVSALDVNTTETAYVYLGGPGGLTSTPTTTLVLPDGMTPEYSASVASAGDVNGDGYGDLVVGATAQDYASIYLGSASGLGSTPTTTLTQPGGFFGPDFFVSVSGAGDVNGDGYADVLVVLAQYAAPNHGFAYVYLGGATGLGTTPATTFSGPAGSDFWATGATAGDVNGDGYGDVVIGVFNKPSAYVYLGGPGGLGTTPAATLTGPNGSSFGLSVAGAGDVNGDGYADVVVGGFSSANAFLFLGGASGLATTPATTLSGSYDSELGCAVASAGDVNGDGYADVVVGALGSSNAYVYLGGAKGLSTTPVTTLSGAGGSNFGDAVASAGDVNGDGYADVVVGAPRAASIAGSAAVYLGGKSGVASTAAATLAGAGRNELFGGSVFGATN